MERVFVITDKQQEIQSWLDLGYEIENMVALHIAAGSTQSYSRYDGKVAVYLIKKN